MLTDELKDQIRTAYNTLVERKSLSPRWGQRQMIAEIARTLARVEQRTAGSASEPAICVIEAGTGTGKTIAYSVAAIPTARALGKRLIVATATVALQEQFVNKDLPDLRTASGLEFSYALAKGRRRYLCLSKLDRLLATVEETTVPLYPDEYEPPHSAETRDLYLSMVDALGRGEWDGDRDTWPGALADDAWFALTTDHSQCSSRNCPNIRQCSFYRARETLTQADVIVGNHDLVLADLALGGGAILPDPEDSIYIFDEGHHLPDRALSHFAGFCRLHTTESWLEDCRKALAAGAEPLSNLPGMERQLGSVPELIEDLRDNLQSAHRVIESLCNQQEWTDEREEHVLRFEQGVVDQDLLPAARVLANDFGKLESVFERLNAELDKCLQGENQTLGSEDAETWHQHSGAMLGRARGVSALRRDYAGGEQAEAIPIARWITRRQRGGQYSYDVQTSPVLASDILKEFLWSRAAAVVVTSATMTALNSFDRFVLHSGVPTEANFKVVASPFDYANAVFSVPAMPCDPSDTESHTGELITRIPDLAEDSAGTLVLFSSRRQMVDVFQGLEADWRQRVLMQGESSKQLLLDRHRRAVDLGKASVIFGLASFAEGVDLPGRYCNHVIIAKIPFAVPDSPLEAALVEWVEKRGGNAFMEVSVPEAALRLVQASGRLLRTESDTGRVTLMDSRIISRRYGRAILDSLPPFRRELGK